MKTTKKTTTKAPFTKKTMALFERACAALKIDPKKNIPQVDGMVSKHQKAVIAFAMLTIIIEYINGNWKADYHKGNPKYWTWHWVKADEKRPGGFGFSHAGANYDLTRTVLGSRLSFGDPADEKKYRKPLEELYVAFKLIKY